jgi:predicted deacylase
MAEAFRAQVTWVHTDQASGRTLSYAMEHGIPAIYTECPASRRVSLPDVDVYQRGVRNVLRELGMMEGELEGEPSPYYLCGVGNTDTALSVSRSGYFIPTVDLLNWVEEGDLLGTVYDLAGNVLEEIHSPSAGYVGLRQLLPTINAGDTVFMLAGRFESK